MNNTRGILRWLTALLAVVFMMAAGASALAASFPARINSSSAKVYASPSTSSSKYVQGGKNITVTVTGYSGSWARIKYRGNTGYTLIKNLDLVNRLKGYTAKSTPVYKSAGYSKMGTLPTGSTVYVVGMNGNYYRIENASGSVTGYVRKSYLTTKRPTVSTSQSSGSSVSSSSASSSSSSSSGSSGSSSSSSSVTTGTTASSIDKVISYALTLVGKPYAASATAPYSFNCSSFVKHCMAKYGYSMQGTAAAQAADGSLTKITSLSSVKKGDVLCFDTDEDGTCDHTAIAMSAGGATFVEASRNAGKVQTNSMDSWYRSHFLWARRPS